MNNFQKQIDVTQKLLYKLEPFFGVCFVAGGAARDWILEKPARDVDIYFRIDSNRSMSWIKATIEEAIENDPFLHNVDCIFYSNEEKNAYSEMQDMRGIYDFEFEGVKFQMIQMDDDGDYNWCPRAIVDMFPFNLCKAYFEVYPDGNRHLEATAEFVSDVQNETITVVNDCYSPEYLEKIQSYFSDYKVVHEND